MKPTASISTYYLMTLHAPLEAPQQISNDLKVYNLRSGGWVRGPYVQGKITPPTADWLRIMPSGTKRLDVRLSILADDQSWIFVSYGGRIATAEQIRQKHPPSDMPAINGLYFMTNPVFETSSPKYGWLNDLICIGKNIGRGETDDDHFVTYDIFALA
ncbi:DUF3237 domain-containing protein [Taklimakanibacter deserti]|uniref:DUF3237 domain-containing protein n=1 Tax=Taklimakanibacter deserti TaxID=2267839 RepID=UPI000E65613F